jgi:hypothetical protein
MPLDVPGSSARFFCAIFQFAVDHLPDGSLPAASATRISRPGTGSALDETFSVTVDSAGNLYIADYASKRIRKVSAATGIIGLPGREATEANYLRIAAKRLYEYHPSSHQWRSR